MKLRLKRVYEPPADGDGLRVLVDRLWPRGLTKEAAGIDLWLKDIAPSDGLRRWIHADMTQWAEFRRRYLEELASNPEAVEHLRRLAAKGKVTLLYGVKDPEQNHARILVEYMKPLLDGGQDR